MILNQLQKNHVTDVAKLCPDSCSEACFWQRFSPEFAFCQRVILAVITPAFLISYISWLLQKNGTPYIPNPGGKKKFTGCCRNSR